MRELFIRELRSVNARIVFFENVNCRLHRRCGENLYVIPTETSDSSLTVIPTKRQRMECISYKIQPQRTDCCVIH